MPGFFDVFFRPAEPEPEPPKPKKVKKAKKDSTEIDELRAEIKSLKKSMPVFGGRRVVKRSNPEPEPEPEFEGFEEPEDDEQVE